MKTIPGHKRVISNIVTSFHLAFFLSYKGQYAISFFGVESGAKTQIQLDQRKIDRILTGDLKFQRVSQGFYKEIVTAYHIAGNTDRTCFKEPIGNRAVPVLVKNDGFSACLSVKCLDFSKHPFCV